MRHIEGELAAARWRPVEPVSPGDEQLEITADGGKCVNIEGSATELVRVDVTESAETVTITTWTRDPPISGACEGVGLSLDTTVNLDEPLGSRTLVDGGLVPPTPVDEAVL